MINDEWFGNQRPAAHAQLHNMYILERCESLTSLTVPQSVTTIERDAFKGCKSLSSITIPKSLEKDAQNALHAAAHAIIRYVWHRFLMMLLQYSRAFSLSICTCIYTKGQLVFSRSTRLCFWPDLEGELLSNQPPCFFNHVILQLEMHWDGGHGEMTEIGWHL